MQDVTASREQVEFKVLDSGGGCCSGGDMQWSLPALAVLDFDRARGYAYSIIPGLWMSVSGEVLICVHGLHLTSDPDAYRSDGGFGARVFIAEGDGSSSREHGGDERKTAYQRARLLRELTWDEASNAAWWLMGILKPKMTEEEKQEKIDELTERRVDLQSKFEYLESRISDLEGAKDDVEEELDEINDKLKNLRHGGSGE